MNTVLVIETFYQRCDDFVTALKGQRRKIFWGKIFIWHR